MAFHKFLDSDKHDVRYVSPLTEERVEVHYNKKMEGAFNTEASKVLERIRRNRQLREQTVQRDRLLKKQLRQEHKQRENKIDMIVKEMTSVSTDPKRLLDRFNAQMLRESLVEGLEDFDWRQGFGHAKDVW